MRKLLVAGAMLCIATPALAQSEEQRVRAQALMSEMSQNFRSMQQFHTTQMHALFQCVRSNAEKYHVLGDITAAGQMNVLCSVERREYTQICRGTGSPNGCDGAAGLVMAAALLPEQEGN